MTALTGFCSMATQHLLADLIPQYRDSEVKLTSISGIEAAARVRAGEACDVVVLAADAIAKLEAEGQVVAGSAVAIADAGIAVAIRPGAQPPDLSTEAGLRLALDRVRKIGYSTGPSGVYLARVFARWGLPPSRLVQAPPGVAVATLVAEGEVEVGFQQLSEMIHSKGITVAGTLPAGVQLITTFSGGVCKSSRHPEAAARLLAFAASGDHAATKRRHGLEQPAAAQKA